MMQKRMVDLIKETIRWNELRYDSEYNHALTEELLWEEIQESMVAAEEGNKVEELDGYMDISFVAIGAMWKYGLDAAEIMFEIDQNTAHSDIEVIHWLANHVNICFHKAGMMFDDPQNVLDAYQIVCESNHSKSIKKTASNIKANDGDRGPYFRDPAPRLKQLLETGVLK